KHEYNQNDFARFHNQIIGTGVSDVDSLTVSAKNNMEIALSTGWIFANGFSLEIENTKTLEHDVAQPDNDRIDRVVVRFDTNPEGLDFYPVIKKGTPAKDPVPPSLTRDNYIYEMSVAQVLIKAGKSYVKDSEMTEERNDYDASYEKNSNIGGDYRHYKIKINPMIDNQNEAQNGLFKASETGTYSFSLHMRLKDEGVPSSDKVESFAVINGKTSSRERLY